jgi:hypothetical protein
VLEDPSSNNDENSSSMHTVEATKETLNAAKLCTADAEKRLWNAASWDIGAAFYDADDNVINESGYSIWTSFSYPVTEHGQMIVYGQLINDMLSPDANSDKVMDIKDGHIIASRLKIGSNKFSLMLEASYSDVEYPSISVMDNYRDYLVGTQFYLMEGFWRQLSYGKRTGSDLPDKDEDYLSGQLRWSFTENSLL